jgi:hypothetical protein
LDIVLGTDSQSLITRIHKELAQITTHPNANLVPDWDITNEIQYHLHRYPFQIAFEHTSGVTKLLTHHIPIYRSSPS